MAALHRLPPIHHVKGSHTPPLTSQKAHADKSVKRFTSTLIAASVSAVLLSIWAAPVSW